MKNNLKLELSPINSTAKVEYKEEKKKEIVEFCNMKKILRNLAPKDTMDMPRVTLDLVMDEVKAETQVKIEAEVDVLMKKIKAIMQKDIAQEPLTGQDCERMVYKDGKVNLI